MSTRDLVVRLASIPGALADGALLEITAPVVKDLTGKVLHVGTLRRKIDTAAVTIPLPVSGAGDTDPVTFQYLFKLTWNGGSLPQFAADIVPGDTVQEFADLAPMNPLDPVFIPAHFTLDRVDGLAEYVEDMFDVYTIPTAANAATAVDAAATATTAKNDAVTARTAAETARTGAQTARTGAETAQTGAQTARTGAEAARDIAVAQTFAGGTLGTADLNTVTTPGLRRQDINSNVTLAANYPPGAVNGTERRGRLMVTVWGGAPWAVTQQYTTIGTSYAHAITYTRSQIADGTWTPWRTGTSQRVVNAALGAGFDLWFWDDVNAFERRLLPYGVDLGTAELNDLTTPGVYRQANSAQATVARGYPIELSAWVIEVSSSGPAAGVLQRATSVWLSGVAGRGYWQRIRQAEGTAWTAWRFVASQRIEKTAGLVIYTWDDVANRDQLVYGDTGYRNITADLALTAGAAYLRRTTYEVEIVMTDFALDATGVVDLPALASGFRPPANVNFAAFNNVGALRAFMGSTGALRMYGAGAVGTTHNLSVRYSTKDPWPTTLPGTATFGAIPNI